METTMLRGIAEKQGLSLIETTDQMNGYPSNTKMAIVGFDTFEQAEEIAKEYNLSIKVFKKRDGWQLWYRTGNTAYEPFNNEEFLQEIDNIEIYTCGEEWRYTDRIKGLIEGLDNLDVIKTLVDNCHKVYEEFATLGEEQMIIIDSSVSISECEIGERFSMSYTEDVYSYEIGLI